MTIFTKCTKWHEQLVAAGGRFSDSDPTGSPLDFGNPRAEYDAARAAVALADRSRLTKIELRGADRAKFLHNLCTNDVKGLAPGDGCEAFITNAHGKILAFVRIFACADSLWLDTVPGVADFLMKHFDRYHFAEKVELFDRSADWSQLLLIGPRSDAVVASLGGSTATPDRDLRVSQTALAGVPCQLIASRQLDLTSYELRLASTDAASLLKQLVAAGQAEGLRLIGEQALDVLRVEAGLPVYGVDITDTNLPQEVSRDRRAISFTKGCYLGQETVARIDALGHVNRHLVGLKMTGTSVAPERGAAVTRDATVVGHITSAVVSPAPQSVLALGYVRRGQHTPGTEVSVDVAGSPQPAVVHSLPFQLGPT